MINPSDKPSQERRDMKAQVAILRRETGELVDHFQCSYDEAERKARNAISGKPELKYKITTML